MPELNFISCAAIAIMCLVVGKGAKMTGMKTKNIPVIVAVAGGILGYIGHTQGINGLADLNIFDSIATGIFSGIPSCGLFSMYKNLTSQYEGNG